MRPVKVALSRALRTDAAVCELVPPAQVFSVERSTVPVLPSIEVIGLSSERVDTGPLIRHELSVECTVRHPSEDGADSLLSDIVRAVRQRVIDAEHTTRPIVLLSGEGCLVVLAGTRWSISASDASSVIRGAAIALSVEVAE